MSTEDRQLFDRLIGDFVPPNVFDVHAHLFRAKDLPDTAALNANVLNDSGNATRQAYDRCLSSWMKEARPTDGLFFTSPHPGLEISSANNFVREQVETHSGSRALLLIHPKDDPAVVESEVEKNNWAGFKVYHVYSDEKPTWQASLESFLPEWAWEIADQHELAITLHIVRERALADVENQQYIREHCRKYKNAKLILAHAARGFCAHHTVEGIESLRGLGNVYFDNAVVCEAAALEAILRVFGPRRLIYGSDFPVSESRGRCVSIGDGFLWIDEKNVDWNTSAFAQPTCVGIESLIALKQACHALHLSDSDVENIFCHNARRLLNIESSETAETGVCQSTYRQAKQFIPGGTQLLSKRPEMYAPDQWPAYFSEARGCEVIDLDGRRYVDMTTSGIGSCLLGYADPDVTEAVIRRVQFGSMSTLNSADELKLAELLTEIHPWADQVRYCRSGGEVMSAAVRIARAHTKRDKVAFCGYHGWTDWYLAANLPTNSPNDDEDRLKGHLLTGLDPAGVPAGLAGTALPFLYNRIDQLHEHVRNYGDELAAVVMEPTRSTDPDPGFLEEVRALCNSCGAVLIFDEISSGWRLHLGGVHLKYGIEPDMAVFAKAIGNGHPMAAIVGSAGVMQAVQSTFISSTYWTESVGPAAALATVRKMQRVDVVAHAERIGNQFRAGWEELGRKHALPVQVTGHAALLHLGFEHDDSAALGTFVTAGMLKHGFLTGSGFYPSLAHTEEHVLDYLTALDAVFAELANAITANDVRNRIGGPVRHTGFSRLT